MTQQTLPRCHNDFRSDTFTTPSPEIFQAMLEATHGDAVYEEDETTNALQDKVAKLTGKEAAVFCVSGTMSNQIGARVNLQAPPHSVLCDYRSHVYTSEANGLAVLSQAMVTAVKPANGIYLTLEDVKANVSIGNFFGHTSPTKLISLENTLSGTIMPIEEIKKISEFAREHDIHMHLDGARLWNASAETGISLAEYCQYFDTISLCLSKGLGAPIGSVLVGSKALIDHAFWIRKQQGGGIRQSGILCAAANYCIDNVWPTMKGTHAKAKELAAWLEEQGVKFALPVDTSFILIDMEKSKLSDKVLDDEAEKLGVKVMSPRICLHHQIAEDSIVKLKEAFKKALAIGPVKSEPSFETAYGTL